MKDLIQEAKELSADGFVSTIAVKNTGNPVNHSTLSRLIIIDLNDEDDVDYLYRRLGPFTPLQRRCYVLHHLCGMKIIDVSRRLGVTTRKVKQQLEFIEFVF